MSDNIKKVVDIDINVDGNQEFDNVNNSLKQVTDNTEKAVTANKKLADSNNHTKKSVLENGGAMGLLSAATGGLAMDFKDAVEAIELTGVSLKGLRGAIIATGVGALAIILLELITNWDKWSKVIDGSASALEKVNTNLAINKEKIDALNDSYEKNKSNLENEIRLLEAQGASYETLYKRKQELYSLDEKNIKDNIASLKNQISELDLFIDKNTELKDLEENLAFSRAKLNKARKEGDEDAISAFTKVFNINQEALQNFKKESEQYKQREELRNR
jgi:hypothetical protein